MTASSPDGARPEVVITGFGALTPVGNDVPSTWRALLDGRSGIAPIAAFDSARLQVHVAAEVKGFDPGFLDTRIRRRTARFSQLALAAAREAVADAGLKLADDEQADGVPADRVAVLVNNTVAGFDTIEQATRRIAEDDQTRLSPYFVSSSLTNMPACEVAIDLGAHGPVNASALACASGVEAFLAARRLIVAGEADVVVCGGTDAAITPVIFTGLQGMGALSRNQRDPATVSRPFDADRDGFVFGEGAVVGVVESAAHARARGATPYARILGGALTADAFHVTAPDPEGRYAALAITRALAAAGVAPDEVDYVCAHGTSTTANDRTETIAIRSAYGSSADDLAVSSPKSMVGHLIGAAGALGVLVCALAVRDGRVPPTINLDTPDPQCDLDYVPHVSRERRTEVAVTNAFGFGGQNCVAVLAKASLAKP
ncbi:MAG TPA: beta-ketoacyl-ACP synthase II [Nocardioidaceae bacterium]|nr:beta-ketoacyl-ACP synthase II [Nocardioidaceae bacterium]